MITKVKLTSIQANPYQPEGRLQVPAETAERFAKSILEHGLLQTPVARGVNGHYEMGDGWLRLSGFRWLAEHAHLEYAEMPLDIRELSDRQMADLILEANEVRQDMTPIDRAKFFKRYLEDFKVTQAELARAHNISQGEVANTIRLLDLPADIQGKVISHEITETHARQLLRLNDRPEEQKLTLANAVRRGSSVNELANDISHHIWTDSKNMDPDEWDKPQFDTAECASCEHQQKIGSPYNNAKKSLRCLNPTCYDKKTETYRQRAEKERLEELKAKGLTGKVLDETALRYGEWHYLIERELKEVDNPAECQTCQRTAMVKGYKSEVNPACVDPKCWRAKQTKKTKQLHAREKLDFEQVTGRLKTDCQEVRLWDGLKVTAEVLVKYIDAPTRSLVAKALFPVVDIKTHEALAEAFANIGSFEEHVAATTFLAMSYLRGSNMSTRQCEFKAMLAKLEGTWEEYQKAAKEFKASYCSKCREKWSSTRTEVEPDCYRNVEEFPFDKCPDFRVREAGDLAPDEDEQEEDETEEKEESAELAEV